MSTEGLYADHGTNDVAVHVDIAGRNSVGDMSDGLIDAGMDTEGEAVAGGIDLGNQLVELLARIAQYMQDRAKHFAFQLVDIANLDQCWRHEGAEAAAFRQRQLLNCMAGIAHLVDMT